MIADYNHYDLCKKEKLMLIAAMSFFLATIGYLFYRQIFFALLVPLLYKKGEKIAAAYFVHQRKKRLLLEFRDFLFSLSTSFSTGRHLTEAMKEAAVYLKGIYGKNCLMDGELQWMIKAIEETGESDQKVLLDFSVRTGLEDIVMMAEVYSACRDTGGDMTKAVNKAAGILTEKINLEMDIQTMISQKRFEGRIITVMPIFMIIFLMCMSPDYLMPMYTSTGGRIVMTGALILNVAAYLWMERMTNVEI